MNGRFQIQSQNSIEPGTSVFDSESQSAGPQYVIERTSETIRDWWTGDRWSSKASDALIYPYEPDAPVETHDESAKSVKFQQIDDASTGNV